jgi:hypothetical protein
VLRRWVGSKTKLKEFGHCASRTGGYGIMDGDVIELVNNYSIFSFKNEE